MYVEYSWQRVNWRLGVAGLGNITRTSNNKGFTLIEVMISVMIFALLMVLYATCIPVAKKASVMNGQFAQAISLCQHKIDQMRAVGYGRLDYSDLNDAEIIDDSPTSSPYSFAP